MSDRGMKKWVAYRALVEQASSLSKTHKEKRKIEKPLISNEEAEKINEILVNYSNEELIITIYKDGFLYEIETKLSKIDPINKELILEDRSKIKLKDLVYLKRKED